MGPRGDSWYLYIIFLFLLTEEFDFRSTFISLSSCIFLKIFISELKCVV